MAFPGLGFDLTFRIGPRKAVLGFGFFHVSDPQFEDKKAEVDRLLSSEFSLVLFVRRWILFAALTRDVSILSKREATQGSVKRATVGNAATQRTEVMEDIGPDRTFRDNENAPYLVDAPESEIPRSEILHDLPDLKTLIRERKKNRH